MKIKSESTNVVGSLHLNNDGFPRSDNSLLNFKNNADGHNKVKCVSDVFVGAAVSYNNFITNTNAIGAVRYYERSFPLGILEFPLDENNEGFAKYFGKIKLPYGLTGTANQTVYLNTSGFVSTTCGTDYVVAGKLITSGANSAQIFLNLNSSLFTARPATFFNPGDYLQKNNPFLPEVFGGDNLTFMKDVTIGSTTGTSQSISMVSGSLNRNLSSVLSDSNSGVSVINRNILDEYSKANLLLSDVDFFHSNTEEQIGGVLTFKQHPMSVDWSYDVATYIMQNLIGPEGIFYPYKTDNNPQFTNNRYVNRSYMDFVVDYMKNYLPPIVITSGSYTTQVGVLDYQKPRALDLKISGTSGITVDVSGTPSGVSGTYLVINNSLIQLIPISGSGTNVTSGVSGVYTVDVTGTFETYKVKTSATGTDDYLENKILAGSGVSIANNGNDLTIDVTGTFETYKVKVSGTDSSPDFLENKVLAGSAIDITNNSGTSLTINSAITASIGSLSGASGIIAGAVTGTALLYLDASYSPEFNAMVINSENIIIRKSLTGDATFDNTFGASGHVYVNVTGTSDISFGAAIITPDQGIVLCGGSTVSSSQKAVVAKLTYGGILDTSFNTSGYNRVTGVDNGSAFQAFQQSTGNIISFTGGITADINMFRFTPSGTLDTTFGASGTGISKQSITASDYTMGIKKDLSTDSFFVAGGTVSGGKIKIMTAKMLPSGTFDTSYNGIGYNIIQTVSGDELAYAIDIQSTGKILLVGGHVPSGTQARPFIVRVDTSGALDLTFGISGVASDYTTTGVFQACSVFSDNSFVAGGYKTLSGATIAFIRKYDSSGTLDTSFATSGELLVDIATGTDYALDTKIVNDSLLVMSASTNSPTPIFITKWTSGGTADTTFASGTNQITIQNEPLIGILTFPSEMAIDASGSIYVPYTISSGGQTIMKVTKITSVGGYADMSLKDYILSV